jgi:GT2 family glycosyltransferase
VAAVVLNYNGKDLTLESLQSLRAQTYARCDLVHVDNGSSDGSWEAVEEAYPEAVQIKVQVNRGIAHGINQGFRHALDKGYDYILGLNNDIVAHPEMVAKLVEAAETDESIGVVGPKTYFHGDPNRIWSAGGILRFREAVTRERGLGELDQGQFDRDQEVDYVNGVAMLCRRRAMEATGLWDPVYYLGVEDADWCVRMKQQGFRCYYAYQAKLWHKVSLTLGIYNPGRTLHTGRSTAIFVRKYGGFFGRLSFFFFATAAIPAAYLRELPKGNQAAAVNKARGYLQGLRIPLPRPPLS